MPGVKRTVIGSFTLRFSFLKIYFGASLVKLFNDYEPWNITHIIWVVWYETYHMSHIPVYWALVTPLRPQSVLPEYFCSFWFDTRRIPPVTKPINHQKIKLKFYFFSNFQYLYSRIFNFSTVCEVCCMLETSSYQKYSKQLNWNKFI